MPPDINNAIERGRAKVVGMFAEIRTFGPKLLLPAGVVLLAEIRQILNRRGTGRFYKSRGISSRLGRLGTRLRGRQLHRASAPFEPPAKDTGELQRSYGIEVRPDAMRVGSPLPQAPALEYGTRGRITRRAQNPDRRRALLSRLRSQRRAFESLARGGSGGKIDPRPHVRPSLANARKRMTDALVGVLQQLTQRHLRG